MKALVFSDVHVGQGLDYGRTPADRLRDFDDVLSAVAELAVAREVDVVLFAGDLYEGPLPRASHYRLVERALCAPLREAGNIPVVAISGNGRHDSAASEGEDNALAVHDGRGRFNVYTRAALHVMPGLAVACVPWAPVTRLRAMLNGGQVDDINQAAAELVIQLAEGLREQARREVPDLPCVLLSHFATTGWKTPTGLPTDEIRDVVLPLGELERLAFDATFLGHIHAPGVIADYPGVFGPILSLGSPLCLSFGEEHVDHGVWIYEDGAAEFVPIASRPFVTIDVELDRFTDHASFFKGFPAWDLTDAIVRLKYTATPEQARHIDQGALRQALLDAGAHTVWKIIADVERETRARVAGVTEHLGPLEALALYDAAHDTPADVAWALRDWIARELETLPAADGAAGGTVTDGLRPTRIVLHNFGPFADVDTAIPDGAVAIVGGNGWGKSTLLATIDVVLFAGKGELAEWVREGETDMDVCVYFSFDGRDYRVRRAWSRGSSSQDFHELVDGEWTALGKGLLDETNAAIRQTFRLTRATYRASASLGQGAGSLAAMKPKEAMELFTAHLGIGVYEQLVDRVRKERAGLVRDIDTLAGAVERLEKEAGLRDELERSVRVLAQIEEAATADLAAVQQQHTAATAAWQAGQESQAETRALAAQRDTAQGRYLTLEQQHADAAHAVAQLAEAVSQHLIHAPIAATLAEREAEVAAFRVRVAEHQASIDAHAAAERERNLKLQQRTAIEAQKRDLIARAEHERIHATDMEQRGPGHDRCTECAQMLGSEALESALATMRVRADELQATAADLKAQLDAIDIPDVGDPPAGEPPRAELDVAQIAFTAARNAATQLAALDERIVHLTRSATLPDGFSTELAGARTALAEAEAALDAARSDQADPAALQHAVAVAAARVDEERARLDEAGREKAVAAAALERVTLAEAELADAQRRMRRLNASRELLDLAEKRCGRTGLPALVLENRVPAIEDEATRILSALGGDGITGARVELRTQKELKDGDAAATLSAVLVTVAGHDRPYRKLSTSEKLRFDVALGKAILPGSLAVMGIDDPSGLDDEGKASLVRVVDWLLGNGLATVFVVSQEAGLRDAIPQVVEVESDGARSRVIGDTVAELEAVLA